MRRTFGTLFMLMGAALLLAALSLLAYNEWDDWRASTAAAQVQELLESELYDVKKTNVDPADILPKTAVTGSDTDEETEETEEIVVPEMDTIEIDGYAYVGTVSIPSFGLEMPVISQWSYAGLKITCCRYSGNVWNDTLVICAHNYDRHFRNLKYLEEGDLVYFTDVNGIVFTYQVAALETLVPTAVEDMITGDEWDLTLFTCTVGGKTRLAVRCTRVEG